MVISAVQSNRTEMFGEGSVVLNGVVRVALLRSCHLNKDVNETRK